MRRVAVVLGMLACVPRGSPEATSGEAAISGTAPTAMLVVPEFVAENFDGSPRSRADLVGHPTIVWFFPAAGTPG